MDSKKKSGAIFASRRPKRIVEELNGLRACGCCRGRRCRLRERAAVRFLLGALVNFDRALEVGAIFNADARRGQVAIDGAIFLDFNAVIGAKITLHTAVDNNFAGNDVSSEFRGGTDGKFPLIELDQSFDGAIDQQIFVAGNFTFDMEARSESCSRTVRRRAHWSQSICTHSIRSLPSRRSGLRRLIHWKIFRLRWRDLRRFRLFLVTPHRPSPRDKLPHADSLLGYSRLYSCAAFRANNTINISCVKVTTLWDSSGTVPSTPDLNSRGRFVGNRLRSKKIHGEAPGVRIEQLTNPLFARRFQQEAGVVIFFHAIGDFGVAVRGSVGFFLARKRKNGAGIVLRGRRQSIGNLPCPDFELGPFSPEIDSRGGFDDVSDIRATDASGNFQKVDLSRGMSLQKLGVGYAAKQTEDLHQLHVDLF